MAARRQKNVTSWIHYTNVRSRDFLLGVLDAFVVRYGDVGRTPNILQAFNCLGDRSGRFDIDDDAFRFDVVRPRRIGDESIPGANAI